MEGKTSTQNMMVSYRLTKKEVKLIEFCRELGYGQCVLYVEDGQPARTEEMLKSRKF